MKGTSSEVFSEEAEAQKFQLTQIALFTAIDIIARSFAKCEFVTVENQNAVTKSEYYLWNYSPNKHQTKIEFFVQAISQLIFQNELLIFETADKQLLIADSFSKNELAIYDDTFSSVTARNWTSPKTYRSSEVLYLKYNNFLLTNLLSKMCESYSKLIDYSQQRYVKSVGHKGILKIKASAANDKEFQKKFNDMMNNNFKQYFKSQDAVLPLYDGFDYSEPQTEAGKTTNSEINDIEKLKNEAFATVGNALHIPPAIISGTASQLSDAVDAFIANAIDPLAQMFEEEITKKRYGETEFLKGNYMLVDTTTVKHIDAVTSANNIDKAIACGVLNPYQAQRYCNILPCSEEWAKTYYMTKNYQTAELSLKGGEE